MSSSCPSLTSADAAARAVDVFVAEDRLSAGVAIAPGAALEHLSVVLIRARLEERGVHWSPAAERDAAALLERYRTDPGQPHRADLIRGTPPTHGEDGRFEFEPGLDPRAIKPAAAPPRNPTRDAVDHYAHSAFVVVPAGTRLGRLLEPTAGADGVDVGQRSIAARAGKPADFLTDASLERRPDGAIVALRAGVVEYSGRLLKINDELVVPAFVDFSTGHIDFAGSVRVARGVRDLFRVRAGLDLSVLGLVEGAHLAAGRDAELAGGMASRERGNLSVGRDLRARYLNNTTAEVGRDLVVDNELVNSQIAVGGRVRAPDASLAGGRLSAARTVELRALGSEAKVTTEIQLGHLPNLERLQAQLRELIPPLEQRAQKHEADLAQLRAVTGRKSHDHAERLTEAEFEAAQARGRLAPVLDRLERLDRLTRAHTQPELIVHGTLFAGVRITLGLATLEVQTDTRGPIRLDLDNRGHPRVTDLTTNAVMQAAALGRVIEAHRAA